MPKLSTSLIKMPHYRRQYHLLKAVAYVSSHSATTKSNDNTNQSSVRAENIVFEHKNNYRIVDQNYGVEFVFDKKPVLLMIMANSGFSTHQSRTTLRVLPPAPDADVPAVCTVGHRETFTVFRNNVTVSTRNPMLWPIRRNILKPVGPIWWNQSAPHSVPLNLKILVYRFGSEQALTLSTVQNSFSALCLHWFISDVILSTNLSFIDREAWLCCSLERNFSSAVTSLKAPNVSVRSILPSDCPRDSSSFSVSGRSLFRCPSWLCWENWRNPLCVCNHSPSRELSPPKPGTTVNRSSKLKWANRRDHLTRTRMRRTKSEVRSKNPRKQNQNQR